MGPAVGRNSAMLGRPHLVLADVAGGDETVPGGFREIAFSNAGA